MLWKRTVVSSKGDSRRYQQFNKAPELISQAVFVKRTRGKKSPSSSHDLFSHLKVRKNPPLPFIHSGTHRASVMAPASTIESTFDLTSHFEEAAALYEDSSDGMKEAASHLLTVGPPLTADSVILDNAAGPGIVTGTILRLPQFIAAWGSSDQLPRIHATDYSPAMIRALEARARREGWPEGVVKTDVMDSMDLGKFPDNLFTHAYMAAAIFMIPDPVRAVAEMKRTLKPGGVSLVTSFEKQGFLEIFQNAQKAVRPDAPVWDGPLPAEWLTEGKLRTVMEGGGFEKANVEIQRFTTWSRGRDWSQPGMHLLREAFTTSITNGWSEEDRASFVNKLGEDLASEQVRSKRFVMKLFVAHATK